MHHVQNVLHSVTAARSPLSKAIAAEIQIVEESQGGHAAGNVAAWLAYDALIASGIPATDAESITQSGEWDTVARLIDATDSQTTARTMLANAVAQFNVKPDTPAALAPM